MSIRLLQTAAALIVLAEPRAKIDAARAWVLEGALRHLAPARRAITQSGRIAAELGKSGQVISWSMARRLDRSEGIRVDVLRRFMQQIGPFGHFSPWKRADHGSSIGDVTVNQEDEDDVGRCLGGDRDAFRGLVARHEGALVRYLAGKSGQGDLAAEVAQEAFVRAYFALAKLQSPALFRPWLLGIADRVLKETLRARKRSGAALRVVTAAGRAARSSDLPEDEVRDRDEELAAAVADLPEAYRQVVSLRFQAGLSCVQIADRLEVSTGTVTSRLSRAYALLRQALRDSPMRLGLEHDAEAPR